VVPDRIEVAPRELLEKLAALVPKVNAKRAAAQRPQGPWTEENTQQYIGVGTDWECKRHDGKKAGEVCRWIGRCVNDDSHTDAAIILHDDGWWSYGCFHTSCDNFKHEQFKVYWTERKGKYKFPGIKKQTDAELLALGFAVQSLTDGVEETRRSEDDEIPLYHLTDTGNAERLTWRYRNQFLYCPQRDWFAWDGKRWKPDGVSAITLASIATVRKIKDELNRALEGLDRENKEDQDKIADITKVYNNWAKTSEGEARLSAMASIGEKFMPVELHQFDRSLMLFNCANGTIDLSTGEMYPAKREDYIAVLSSIEYDAMAECPLWLSFLNDVTNGNEELTRYLQRAVGYSLTGLAVEHCMFILWGTGRNGKSTFLEVIHRMMGEYAKAAHMNTFMAKKNDEGIPNDLAGHSVPAGTVTFTAGSVNLGTVPLNGSGQASITTSSMTPGTYSVVASYTGQESSMPSQSSPVSVVIAKVQDTLALTAAPNPAKVGAAVTISAAVQYVSGNTFYPTGSVTIKDASTTLATLSVSDRAASFTTSSLAVGTHSLSATYSGDANFVSATAAGSVTITP